MSDSYTINIRHKIAKKLEKLPDEIFLRVDKAIMDLSENPYPDKVKKLKIKPPIFRIRVGDYRVVYSINEQLKEITIVNIGHRRDIYKYL